MEKRIRMNLQFFAEEGASEDSQPTTVKIGDKEYSVEDLQNKLTGYEKLEKQFTKVSQENGELRRKQEPAQKWMDFDAYVAQFPAEVQQQLVQEINSFFAKVQTGNIQQKDITGINKAIKTAEKAGDDDTADKLKDARDEALVTMKLNETLEDLEEQAEEDGIPFKKREFKQFLAKYLEDEGYDEDDDFDEREIKRAYKLYRAEKKEKAAEDGKKQNLPNVGTGGSGIGVGANKQSKAPKNLKEAREMARNFKF